MFGKQNNNNNSTNQVKEKDIKTVVGETIKVKGNFTGKGSIIINGQVEGNIKSHDTVFVGEKARILGNINANKAIVNGEIIGNIDTEDCLELKSTARINGDIKCSVLSIEKGLVLNGKCTMEKTQNIESKNA